MQKLLVSTIAFVVSLSASMAMAAPWFSEDFEDMTVGTYPREPENPGSPFNLFNARDTFVGEFTRVTDERAVSGTKSVLGLAPENDISTSFYSSFNAPVTQGIYTFHMYLEEGPNSDFGEVQFLLRDGTSANIALNLFIGTPGIRKTGPDGFTDEAGIELDQWHEVSIHFDQTNATAGSGGTYSVFVDGQQIGVDRALVDDVDITTIWLAGNANGHKYFDDVSLQPIPEPGSLGLLTAGACLLIRRHGRK